MEHQVVLVVDFGGQYNQLIVRRVRNLNVYAVMISSDTSIEKIKSYDPKGIIFTGGPSNVNDADAPKVNPEIFNLGVPVLGICYGMQLTAFMLGGNVIKADMREYGKREITYSDHVLFEGIPKQTFCWMSHTCKVDVAPEGFYPIADTPTCKFAAFANDERKIYGVQFHPEVVHTANGNDILRNFLYKICKVKGDWTMNNFAEEQIRLIREKAAGKKVLCAMSGGVDSAVAATLVHKAIGNQLTCVFVDTGLLRKNEADQVMKVFKDDMGMNLIKADAGELFLTRLKGVSDPETKRKIIGKTFIDVFAEEAKKIGAVDYLVQGTTWGGFHRS